MRHELITAWIDTASTAADMDQVINEAQAELTEPEFLRFLVDLGRIKNQGEKSNTIPQFSFMVMIFQGQVEFVGMALITGVTSPLVAARVAYDKLNVKDDSEIHIWEFHHFAEYDKKVTFIAGKVRDHPLNPQGEGIDLTGYMPERQGRQ
ncbi:MAG: hypothetical protein BroJett011_14430 [Chloroflexota bacterium]|nr:MAG: hypothetical protein BroJett011_14430 [Chloroflexota bacterium]